MMSWKVTCVIMVAALTSLSAISFGQSKVGPQGRSSQSQSLPSADSAEKSPDQPETKPAADGLSAFLSKNIKYPTDALENGYQGKPVVSFTVRSTGRVGDVKLEKSSGYASIDSEAVRVVRLMENGPLWKPGKQKGEPVDVIFSLPITFSLK